MRWWIWMSVCDVMRIIMKYQCPVLTVYYITPPLQESSTSNCYIRRSGGFTTRRRPLCLWFRVPPSSAALFLEVSLLGTLPRLWSLVALSSSWILREPVGSHVWSVCTSLSTDEECVVVECFTGKVEVDSCSTSCSTRSGECSGSSFHALGSENGRSDE